MIRNQWYVVLSSKQVGRHPIGVTRLGERLVFWRGQDGKVGCLTDQCPHRGVQFSKGVVVGDGVHCPFHGFEFDRTGRATFIPANGKSAPVPKGMRACSYPVYEAHGFVWIFWGDRVPGDIEPPRFFADIDGTFSYAEARDPWKAHYSRAIENQLDVLHLPFVHYNNIGRGRATLVDGPGMKWRGEDGYGFDVYVHNRVDDGSRPLRPSEFLIEPEPEFKLEFIFPNLWQNHISDKLRIVVAFVPIDDAHSLLYLRSYQKFMTVPVLRDMINSLSMPFNLYILHQDRRVVETQEPKASTLRAGEFLVPGDYPIVEYRRRRAELKGERTQPT